MVSRRSNNDKFLLGEIHATVTHIEKTLNNHLTHHEEWEEKALGILKQGKPGLMQGFKSVVLPTGAIITVIQIIMALLKQ